jgi:RNA polymerase sigma factor (sigma-70 family)
MSMTILERVYRAQEKVLRRYLNGVGYPSECTDRNRRGGIYRDVTGAYSADDILQEAYLQMMERLADTSKPPIVGGEAAVKNYLFIVTRNTARRVAKREKKHMNLGDQVEDLVDSEWEQAFVGEMEGLETLTPRQFEVCSMYREGFTQAEIAEELEISPSAVSQIFAAAKKKLEVIHGQP